MIEKVAAYIRAHHMIQTGDHVIAGVSGGADSVCLFLILEKLRHTMGFFLSAVHIEHGIRGEESLLDLHFTEQLCRQYEVPFSFRSYPVEKIAKEQGISVEEAGRNARYEAFEQEAVQYGGEASLRGGTVKIADAVSYVQGNRNRRACRNPAHTREYHSSAALCYQKRD